MTTLSPSRSRWLAVWLAALACSPLVALAVEEEPDPEIELQERKLQELKDRRAHQKARAIIAEDEAARPSAPAPRLVGNPDRYPSLGVWLNGGGGHGTSTLECATCGPFGRRDSIITPFTSSGSVFGAALRLPVSSFVTLEPFVEWHTTDINQPETATAFGERVKQTYTVFGLSARFYFVGVGEAQ